MCVLVLSCIPMIEVCVVYVIGTYVLYCVLLFNNYTVLYCTVLYVQRVTSVRPKNFPGMSL